MPNQRRCEARGEEHYVTNFSVFTKRDFAVLVASESNPFSVKIHPREQVHQKEGD